MKLTKHQFATCAASKGLEMTVENLPELLKLNNTVPHDMRPRADTVRAWAGFDFAGNSTEAKRIRTERA